MTGPRPTSRKPINVRSSQALCACLDIVGAVIDFIRVYWPGVLIGLLILSLMIRRMSASYSREVIKELEEYAGQAPSAEVPPSSNTTDSTVVAEHKTKIWQMVQANSLPPEAQIATLVNNLAEMHVFHRFITVRHTIFQSQMFFLRALNNTGGITTRAEAEAFYANQLGLKEGLKDVPFVKWVGYLVDAGLLSVTVDAFSITPIGQDYLIWCIRRKEFDPNFN